MKIKKILGLSLVSASVVALTACGYKGPATDEYITTYSTHFETLDYLVSSSAIDSGYFANMVDSLLENDKYGTLVPSLATEVPVGKQNTGKTTYDWELTIKDDIKWYKSDGTEYADVTAHDWVSAAKYVNNPSTASETQYIFSEFIVGAEDYFNALSYDADLKAYEDSTAADKKEPVLTSYGFASVEAKNTASDFDNVGVKASDDGKTLTYTTKAAMPYFTSALTYSCFLPVNDKFLKDAGTSFGLNQNNILVNGAFFMSANVVDNRIELSKNENYWDADEIHINRIEFKKIPDGNQDAAYSRKLYEAGQISAFTVSENDKTGWEDYVTGKKGTGSTSNPINPQASVSTTTSVMQYFMIFNFNRTNYTSTNTTKTDTQKSASVAAMQDETFRQGLVHGINTMDYLSYYNETEPEKWAKRTFTVSGLCEYEGKDYVDYIADAYAKNESVTVDEAKAILASGQDSIYDITKATALFKKYYEDNNLSSPIQIDTIGSTTELAHAYIVQLADSFNAAFGQYVKIDVAVPTDAATWTTWSNTDMSYDLRVMMGWGPDYADPYTFLSTYAIGGTMINYAGLGSGTTTLQEKVLGDFDDLLKAANAITDPTKTDERYAAFAEAEYNLLFESALMLPYLNQAGATVIVSNAKPFTAIRSAYGLSGDKYKGLIMLEEACTADQRTQWEAEYEAERP